MIFKSLFYVFGFIAFFILGQCKTKTEKVPAYLQIDSVELKCLSGQGNGVNALNAFYTFIDGDFLGIFELPLKVPVLYSGKHHVSLLAAFQPDGSSLKWVSYIPLNSADTTINFTPGKVSIFNNGVFTFKKNAIFPWTEDFEDNNSSIVFDTSYYKGDTLNIVSENFDLKGRFASNTRALQLDLKACDSFKYVTIKSFNTFTTLPNDGTGIFFEFDLKSPIDIDFALSRKNTSLGINEYVPFLTMYATGGKWKHFMVNLVAEIAGKPAGTKYNLLFSLIKPPSYTSEVKILFDNLRLVYIK